MLYIDRDKEVEIRKSLQNNPATAITGPRQCGKSTLAKHIFNSLPDTVYLDLERPSDLRKLADPEWFLTSQKNKLVCLDEIQRHPELFPVLRSLIDERNKSGMYLILGSASRDLLRQSSESLAGRIHYVKLTQFLWSEINAEYSLEEYLYRGGFPRSIFATDDKTSYEWRQDFISTFLERDLLQFRGFTPATMRRLWQMLAHSNGQVANLSKLGSSLGISHTTVRQYLDLLEGTFMVKQVLPYSGNTKKRLIKSPKVYISDTGIVTALLELKNYEQATGHPVYGSLWETFVLLNLVGHFPDISISFYRTSRGYELDFIIQSGSKKIAIDCKASVAPELTQGNYVAYQDLNPDHFWVVSPVSESYEMSKDVTVLSMLDTIESLKELY